MLVYQRVSRKFETFPVGKPSKQLRSAQVLLALNALAAAHGRTVADTQPPTWVTLGATGEVSICMYAYIYMYVYIYSEKIHMYLICKYIIIYIYPMYSIYV